MRTQTYRWATWIAVLGVVLAARALAGEDSQSPNGDAPTKDAATATPAPDSKVEVPADAKAAAEAAFREGYESHRKGQLVAAIASYTKAIQLDPGCVRAYNNRGLAYQAKRNLNRAVADFSEAIRLSPTLSAAYLNRGIAVLKQSDFDRAIADLTQAIRLDPKCYRAYKMRAAAYDVKGDKRKATADMMEAVRCYQPKYDTIAHKAIKLELDVKDKDYTPNYELLESIIDEAKTVIKSKKAVTENDALAVLQMIDQILLEHRFVVADQSLLCDSLVPRQVSQRMLDSMDPRQRRFRMKVNDTVYFSHALAVCLIYASIGEALDLPIQVALVPGHALVQWPLADGTFINWETTIGSVKSNAEYTTRMRISDKLIKDGLYLTPLTHDEMLASVLCNIAMVWSGEWYGLENSYRGKGDKNASVRAEKAIGAVTKAIEMNKKSYEAFVQRGMYFSRAKEHDKAIADNTQAILLDSNQPAGYFGRGLAFLSSGENAKAIEDFNKTIEMNPMMPAAHYFRGVAKAQNKDLERAIIDFDKATELSTLR